MRRWVAGAAVAFCVAGLAACGGNGKPGAAKANFIKAADNICDSVTSKVTSLGNGTDSDTLSKVSDAWANAYSQLNALSLPSEANAKGLEFIADIHNIATTADGAYQSSLVQAEANLVTQRISDEAAAKKKASDAGDDYGFKSCNHLDGQ